MSRNRNKKHPIFQNKKIQFLVFKAIHPKQKAAIFDLSINNIPQAVFMRFQKSWERMWKQKRRKFRKYKEYLVPLTNSMLCILSVRSKITHHFIFYNSQNFSWNIDDKPPGTISGGNSANISAPAFLSNGNSTEHMKIICNNSY